MGVPASNDILLGPATELARMLRERELSAVELLELHVARIEERNGELNALVLPRLEKARGEAVAADRALAAGARIGPLHGIPFSAKDAIAVAGMRWPNGSRLFADDVAGYDAPAIRRMRGAGAILLGKTNVPEFCAFYDTVNDLFGATCNPHAPERSAGGEAAAVASGMSALGIGSDLGSSIRNPAHFTGVFGLKPSRELVPCTGHTSDGETPLWSRLAVEVSRGSRRPPDAPGLIEMRAARRRRAHARSGRRAEVCPAAALRPARRPARGPEPAVDALVRNFH